MPRKFWKHEFRTWIITFSHQIQQKNTCKTPKFPGNTDTTGILYTSLTKQKHRKNTTNTTFQNPPVFHSACFGAVFFSTHNHHWNRVPPWSRRSSAHKTLAIWLPRRSFLPEVTVRTATFFQVRWLFPNPSNWGNVPGCWDFLEDLIHTI